MFEQLFDALGQLSTGYTQSAEKHATEVQQRSFLAHRQRAGLEGSIQERQDYIERLHQAACKLEVDRDRARDQLSEEQKLGLHIEQEMNNQLACLRGLQEKRAQRRSQEEHPTLPWLPIFSKTGSFEFLRVPAHVLHGVYGYLGPVDLVHTQQTCRVWKETVSTGRLWAFMTRALHQGTARARSPEVESTRTHPHYALGIEIANDSYVVTVENEGGVDDEACAGPNAREATRSKSSVEADRNRRGIVINVCALQPRGLKEELQFCSSVIAEHTRHTQAKMDKATLLAQLDHADGAKQALSKQIEHSKQTLQEVQTKINYVKLQHASDECTTQFLEEQLAKLETDVMASEMDTIDLISQAKQEVDDKERMLSEVKREKEEKASSMMHQHEELTQHKLLLANEVKTLQKQLETQKLERDKAHSRYNKFKQQLAMLQQATTEP